MTTLIEALEAEHHFIDKQLEEFAAQVANGTADSAGIANAFALLRRHIYVEEEFMFPPLREAGMMMPILVMLREHGEIWRSMDTIEQLLVEGGEASDVVKGCEELLEILDRHNQKEEPIVYPEAEKVLTEATAGELVAFLDGGEMPEDWMCEQALS